MVDELPLKGRVIRGYELGDLLGRGGYGAVYRAFQPTVQRDVAIKVILPEYAAQEEFIRNFEVEAQLVARLEHPHIVPLYDFWRDETGAYLVMRYLRKGSLRGRLKENGALDIHTAARFLDQIGAALATAHRSGIVHRDLKPDNILLDSDGNAYLTDFGIAKPVGFTITDGLVTGTLAYIAPEQLEGRPPLPQSDIYSLGFVLYEMLTGAHPFSDVSFTEMLMKHLHDQVRPLNLPYASAPLIDAINTVISRMTAKAPGGRYSDALAAANAFRKALQTLDKNATAQIPIFAGQVEAFPAASAPAASAPAVVDTDGSKRALLQDHIDQLYGQLNQLYKALSNPPTGASPSGISPSDLSTNADTGPYDGRTLPPTPISGGPGRIPVVGLAGLVPSTSTDGAMLESPTLRARIEQLKVEIAYRSVSLESVKQYAAFAPTLALTPPTAPQHPLVGLDELHTTVRERLLTGASLTLLGPSGVGKTELAAALARDSHIIHAFERRVVWITVGKGGDVFEPLGEWLRAMGATAEEVGGLRTRAERMKRLGEWLTGRKWLVFIDDVWQLDAIQETLLDRRYALNCLITTRQANVAADVFWEIVHVRELPNAARLHMLEALCPGFTADDDGRRLVERVGGLPRDLVLTGTRLRRAGNSVSRMRREIDRLTQAPIEAMEGGYASLRLSVEALSEGARRAFSGLGVFPPEPNTFSEGAGEAVVGDIFHLDELVDSSLLRGGEQPDGEMRYALHPSTFEYILKYSPPDTEAVEAFTTYTIDFIDEYGRDFERVMPEMRSIEAVLRRMADSAESERKNALVRAVIALYPCWKARGMVEAAATYLADALACAEAGSTGVFADSALAVAQLRLFLAELALDLGELDRAEAHTAGGLEALDKLPDSDDKTRLLIQLTTQRGVLAYSRRDMTSAKTIWSPILDSPDISRYPAEVSRIYNGLATVELFTTGDYVQAKAHFLKSLEEARRARQPDNILMALNNLGQLEHHYLDETPAAVGHLEESLALGRSVGDYRRISFALQALANIAMSAGRPEQAQTYFEEALQKARASRSVDRIGFALMQLANMIAAREDFEGAETYLAESMIYAQKRQDGSLMTQIINVLTKVASLRLIKARVVPPAPVYATALTATGALEVPAEVLWMLKAAVARLTKAGGHADNNRESLVYARLAVGRVERDDFYDAEEALRHFNAALTLAEPLDQPVLLALILIEMAETQEGEGNITTAVAHCDRAAPLIEGLTVEMPNAAELRERLEALRAKVAPAPETHL